MWFTIFKCVFYRFPFKKKIEISVFSLFHFLGCYHRLGFIYYTSLIFPQVHQRNSSGSVPTELNSRSILCQTSSRSTQQNSFSSVLTELLQQCTQGLHTRYQKFTYRSRRVDFGIPNALLNCVFFLAGVVLVP